jgi:peptidyl-prolyl cis-trans isomerase SurA
MKRLFIFAIITGSIATAAGQVASHQQAKFEVPSATLAVPTGKPVAKVNGAILTDIDLVREEYAIFPYAKQHSGSIPKDMEPGIRKGALEMIIFEELAYQDAKKRGYTVSPEKLAAAEKDFRKRFASEDEYQQFLKFEFGGKQELLNKRIERSLLIEKYLTINVTQKAAISPAELKADYDKSGARFAYPESFALQTVSIMPPANATKAQMDDARKRAEEALKQAKATKTPEEFGLLAEKVSEDDYRVMMGDHKWVAKDKVPPEILKAALAMKKGDVSDLLQVGPTYVVFRLNGHVQAGKYKYSEVEKDLRKQMEQQKTEQVQAALNAKLRQSAKIETL